MKLDRLRIRGTFRGFTGHDNLVRGFVRALVHNGVTVELQDMPEWSGTTLPSEALDPWFETLARRIRPQATLQFCMPHQQVELGGSPNINYTMFEADRICDRWVREFDRSIATVVPTESARAAWLIVGVDPERVHVCPLGIDPERFAAKGSPLTLVDEDGRAIASYRRRFLNLSEAGPRKNLSGLLRAWIRATTPADDAVLLIKLGIYRPVERIEFSRRARAIALEDGKTLADAAPIVLMVQRVPEEHIPRLYASATHYVSLSFGEAWDQPMFEAAASGLQLISPDHTAYRTYLDDRRARFIPCSLEPVGGAFRDEHEELFDGARWWHPDEVAAARLIRDAIDDVGARTESAADRILRDFTWERAAARLVEVIELALANRPRARWPWHR